MEKQNKKDKKDKEELVKPQSIKAYEKNKINVQGPQNLALGGNVFSQLSSMYNQQEKQEQKNSQEPEIIQDLDPEFVKILTMIQKISEVTKQKGLQDLKSYIQNNNPEMLEKIYPNFCFLYRQLSTTEPTNSKNLILINQALKLLITKNKKALQPHFKQLFFYWYLSINDSNPEISQPALQIFDQTFPGENSQLAIISCLDDYMKNLKFFLDINNDKKSQTSDKDASLDAQDRIIYCCLQSIKTSCNGLLCVFYQKFMQSLEQNLLKEPLSNTSILTQLLNQKKGTKIVAAFIDIIPSLFENKEKLKENMQFITNLISQNLLSQNEFIQKSLWKNGLGFLLDKLQKFPVKNDIQQKLIENIKTLGFFIGQDFYSNLTMVLSKITVDKQFDQFLNIFFGNLRKGLQIDENRFFSEHLVIAYFQCCNFICQKRENYQNNVIKAVYQILQEYILHNEPGKINFASYQTIPKYFSQLLADLSEKKETQVEIVKQLSQLKIHNKMNQNEIINNLTGIKLHSEAKEIFDSQIKELNSQYISELTSLLEETQQNDDILQEITNKVQEFNQFLLNITDFQSQNTEVYSKILQRFIKNIYQYKNIELIENFSIQFSKICGNIQQIQQQVLEFYKEKQNQKTNIFVSYFIDQNLSLNIFKKIATQDFQQDIFEQEIRKQKQKISKIKKGELNQILEEIIKLYIKYNLNIQSNSLTLFVTLFDLQNHYNSLDLQFIFQELMANFNYLNGYLFFFVQIESENYQYLEKFHDLTIRLENDDQIDSYYGLISEKKSKQIIELVAKRFQENNFEFFKNVSQLEESQFSKICYSNRQFMELLCQFEEIQTARKLFIQIILNQKEELYDHQFDHQKVWVFVKELLEPLMLTNNMDYIFPSFVNENFWIFSVYMCLNRNICISKSQKLFNFYKILQSKVETLILHQNQDFISNFFEYLLEKAYKFNLIHINSLQTLSKLKENNQIYTEKIKHFLESKNDSKSYLISFMILPYFWTSYEQIFPEGSYITKLGLQLSVKDISFQEKDIEKINQNLFETLEQNNFNFFVFFKYLNYMIEQGNLVYFSDFIIQIEKNFNQALDFNKDEQPFQLVTLLEVFSFIRKVSNLLEMFTSEFQNFIKSGFFLFCQQKLQCLSLIQDGNQQIQGTFSSSIWLKQLQDQKTRLTKTFLSKKCQKQ